MSTTTTTVTEPITADNIIRLFGADINTEVIGGNARQGNSNNADADLAGYDEEQIRLMDEMCIVLDENDSPIGSASKKVCKWRCAPLTILIRVLSNQSTKQRLTMALSA